MLYCYVSEGQIKLGPGRLPKAWENISGLNLLDAEGLKALGWLPFIDVKPAYDKDTQFIMGARVITADAVTMNNTVNDYSVEEMASKITAAKGTVLSSLYTNVKQFISYQESGWPRYDDDLKLNIMNASMTAIAAGQAKPANCVLVETWIYTVQTAFFGLKATIVSEEIDTLAKVRDIDVTYDWFETRYGREGTIAADPGISTDDLFA